MVVVATKVEPTATIRGAIILVHEALLPKAVVGTIGKGLEFGVGVVDEVGAGALGSFTSLLLPVQLPLTPPWYGPPGVKVARMFL